MTVFGDGLDVTLGEVDAADRGQNYLVERLLEGGALPRAIVASRNLAGAPVYAIAPDSWTPSQGFEAGGVTQYRAARRHLFDLLDRVTNDVPDSAIVARHGLALPKDPVLQDRRTACFFFGNEVYRFIREPFEHEDVAALWNEAETPVLFSFAVVRWPADLSQVQHGSRLHAGGLDRLAQAAVLVGINIFDGESYLIAELGH